MLVLIANFDKYSFVRILKENAHFDFGKNIQISLNFNEMKGLIVREAQLTDLAVLKSFEQELIKAERPYDPTIRDDATSYYDLKDYITRDEVFVVVAVYEDEIVSSGYVFAKPARSYLDHEFYAHMGFMFTLPEFRGKGINQKIIKALSEWASEKNLVEARLTVYNDNHGAIRAYEKAGFSKHLNEMRIRLKP